MNAVLVLTLALVVTSILANYSLARGKLKPTHVWMILAGMVGIALNTALFLSDSNNYGVLLLHLTAAWQIGSNTVGLFRGKGK